MDGSLTTLEPQASEAFVETPYVRELTERALGYLGGG